VPRPQHHSSPQLRRRLDALDLQVWHNAAKCISPAPQPFLRASAAHLGADGPARQHGTPRTAGGRHHPPLGPQEGLPAQAPARLGGINSERYGWIFFMCVGKVNKKLWCLVSTCLTWAPSSESRSGVRGRARALGAAGEDGNPWCSPLEDSPQPQSARWCRLAPASWPPETSVRIRDLAPTRRHLSGPAR
jgi:hypothetical protein